MLAAPNVGLTIMEIGALDINGSLRSVAPPGSIYLGLDTVGGKGVDIVIDDPYVLPFEERHRRRLHQFLVLRTFRVLLALFQ